MKTKMISLFALSIVLTSDVFAQNWNLAGNAAGNNSGVLGTTDNKRWAFISNNKERGRLTSTGLWGFAVKDPLALVHINSTTDAPTPFRVDVTDVASLIVSSSGRTGMGTTSPSAKLHINSAAAEDALRVQTNGTTRLYVTDNGGVSIGTTTAGPAGGLYVAGNLGVGVSAPTNKFEVSGNSLFTGNVVSTGTLTATGNISTSGNLDASGTVGFGSVETFSDGGSFTIASNSDIVTTSDGTNSLGSSSKRWADVWAVDGTINTSDAKLKENVRDLDYGLKDVLKMHAVKFNWKGSTDKTKIDKLGIIAQEMQKIVPEVVRDYEYQVNESTGERTKVPAANLGVMYSDLIPVLIKAIQEQQVQIDKLQEKLAAFENMNANANRSVNADNDIKGTLLEQNQPNPFNQTTVIRYKIPQGAMAQIVIFDAQGSSVKTLRAADGGQVQLTAGELKPGTYTYSLLVNGRLAATKKMVIMK